MLFSVKHYSVLLWVLGQPRVDNSSAWNYWFNWLTGGPLAVRRNYEIPAKSQHRSVGLGTYSNHWLTKMCHNFLISSIISYCIKYTSTCECIELSSLMVIERVVVIVWQLDLPLPIQSVPISNNVTSSNSARGEVYSIQHDVITFVSDLLEICGFHLVLCFPPPIKLTETI